MRIAATIAILICVITAFVVGDSVQPLPALDSSLRQQLADYLATNALSPEEYVLSKFKDHDIVFVGEWHLIKHNLDFIHGMIPALHKNGICNLGIEFACHVDQPKIDSLITASEWNEKLARWIQFRNVTLWGYREYVDIYKVAWELNRKLPPDARKFRVVGLNTLSDWSKVWTVEDRDNPDIMRQVWINGGSDEVMARNILDEFVKKGEKALIYCGANHSFTKYKQPIYDEQTAKFIRFGDIRAGNIVFDSIGNRTFNIYLHAVWPNAEGWSKPNVHPADGVIDALMHSLPAEKRRVGFDLVGSPFGELKGETSLWKHGYDNFRLKMFYDGYIYFKTFPEYEPVGVIDDFISEESRLTAITQMFNPRGKDTSLTVSDLVEYMKRSTSMNAFHRME
jgi:hypothetical protein